jgi:hypothetical protein
VLDLSKQECTQIRKDTELLAISMCWDSQFMEDYHSLDRSLPACRRNLSRSGQPGARYRKFETIAYSSLTKPGHKSLGKLMPFQESKSFQRDEGLMMSAFFGCPSQTFGNLQAAAGCWGKKVKSQSEKICSLLPGHAAEFWPGKTENCLPSYVFPRSSPPILSLQAH